jgi:hypothetical protein
MSLTFVAGERGFLQHPVHPRILVKHEARVVLPVGAHVAPGLYQQVDQVVHILPQHSPASQMFSTNSAQQQVTQRQLTT